MRSTTPSRASPSRCRPSGLNRLIRLTTLTTAVAAAAGVAQAATDNAALRTEMLAATCANCHGTAGAAVAQASVPGLAGLPRGYLIEQMAAFKAGTREATVMHQLAKGYSDAQIAQLATYFSALPR